MFPPPTAKTAARGYGGPHQKLRKWWAPRVATGQVLCWRCGHPIRPGEAWDLGHDDHDRSIYRGPEHRHPTPWCKGNRRAGLIKAANNNRRKARVVKVIRPSTAARW
jgi:hypothetical protein